MVDARRVAAAGAIERRSSRWLGVEGLAQSYGYRRGSELIEQATGVSAATARKRIGLAESLAQRDGPLGAPLEPLFPVVANAAAAGQIGMDAARAITTELKQVGMRADPQDVRVAERLLVAQAAGRAQMLSISASTRWQMGHCSSAICRVRIRVRGRWRPIS